MAKSPSALKKVTSDLGKYQPKSLTQILVILVVVVAFLLGIIIGILYTRVQYLEQGATINTNVTGDAETPPSFTNDDIKSWAKEIGLNTENFNQCFDSNKYQSRIDEDLSGASEVGAQATPTFFINGVLLEGAQPYDAFKTAIESALQGTQTEERQDVGIGHFPAEGSENAPVTIVEFSDFECPFCLRFYAETLPQIKKEYIDSGKVKFYYRQLPIPSLHPMAVPFANAAECANEQGKFWEMHNIIFDKQRT